MTPPDRTAELQRLLAERILVLDGAMGSMIQTFGLEEADYRGERFGDHPSDLKGDGELLSITRPDVIEKIHDDFLAAGADILETNTFGSNAVAQADYAMEAHVYEMNRRSAEIAVACARRWSEQTPDKPRFVAGAIGPTPKTLSISPDVNDASLRSLTFDELYAAYAEQTLGLRTSGGARRSPTRSARVSRTTPGSARRSPASCASTSASTPSSRTTPSWA